MIKFELVDCHRIWRERLSSPWVIIIGSTIVKTDIKFCIGRVKYIVIRYQERKSNSDKNWKYNIRLRQIICLIFYFYI